MPRDNSGTYTLPAGNPVAANTVIETAWANPTMSDLATTLTQSLDRSGRGTMLAALKLIDGTQSQPSLTFNAEASTGLYRAGTHDLRVSVGGADVIKFTDAGATLTAGITVSSGQLLVNSGTETLPSIAFSGDPNVGIWRPGVNMIAISTAGVERVRWTAPSGRTEMLLGLSTALNSLSNRGLLEISGTNESMLSLTAAGALCSYVQGHKTAGLRMGTQAALPILFLTNSVESGRFTPAAQAEFLVGTTTSSLTLAGRGIVEVNGTASSMLVLSKGAAQQGYLFTDGTAVELAALGTLPLRFATGATARAAIDNAGVFTYAGEEVGWRSLPANNRTANYTIAITDRGKHVRADNPTTLINCPGAVFAQGDAVTIVNNNTASSGTPITIGAVSGLTMRWTTNTGNRTLAFGGVCTVLFISPTTAIISGSGLS